MSHSGGSGNFKHVCDAFIGNRLFNVQTIREIEIEKKNTWRLKKVSTVSLSMYVYLCVCVFVCLSVITLHTSSFNIGVWNSNTHSYMEISQNGIFYFFEISLFYGVIPLFIFHNFLYFETTSQPIMKINTPNWSLGPVKCIMYN